MPDPTHRFQTPTRVPRSSGLVVEQTDRRGVVRIICPQQEATTATIVPSGLYLRMRPASMSRVQALLRPGATVPKPEDSVVAARGDGFSIGAPCDRVDVIAIVLTGRESLFAAFHVPRDGRPAPVSESFDSPRASSALGAEGDVETAALCFGSTSTGPEAFRSNGRSPGRHSSRLACNRSTIGAERHGSAWIFDRRPKGLPEIDSQVQSCDVSGRYAHRELSAVGTEGSGPGQE